MNFSNELIDKYKKIMNVKTDAEVAELMPEMNKGNLSKIRKGIEGRHLSEKQAIWIAQQCGLDCAQVLVGLAAECAKTDAAKAAWSKLGKMLAKTGSALAIATIVLFSQVSGHPPLKRDKSLP
jgi:hypothetical protein